MPADLGWKFSARFKGLCLQTIKNHINLNCQRRNGFQSFWQPNNPSSALCRKGPEANAKPPTQMPVEFARKPDPAASAVCYFYYKTKSCTASNLGSLSANQQQERDRLPWKKWLHKSTPKYGNCHGLGCRQWESLNLLCALHLPYGRN